MIEFRLHSWPWNGQKVEVRRDLSEVCRWHRQDFSRHCRNAKRTNLPAVRRQPSLVLNYSIAQATLLVDIGKVIHRLMPGFLGRADSYDPLSTSGTSS